MRSESADTTLSRSARLLPLWLLALLQACVLLPRTVETYRPECRIVTRQVVLEPAALGHLHACAGPGCSAALVTVGVVAAASVVVSGSIAVVGNIVYWFEEQGRCDRAPERSRQPIHTSPAASRP
ncbi:MAG: hypothetical protein H7Z19_03780 [Chitinophagaceae bacterium]|nr:hypothetical protein [Rubrivivax sp.]